MKTIVEQKEVLRLGDMPSEQAFSIDFTPQVAQLLSDGVYSDKILAVVRELSCNAYDAHVEAGTENKPFILHLPTRLEPWFSIRDFGPGLTPEQVKEVYTVYFLSTKNQSNDYIGCLGIGAKSPFAYIDTFSVTSYVDGKVYNYAMHKGNEGMPAYTPLGVTDSNEDNGLLVRMDVAQRDIDLFIDKAEQILVRFKVKPTITGSTHFKHQELKYDLHGTGWKMRDRDSRYDGGTSGAVAIMGNIGYPLQLTEHRSEIDPDVYKLLDAPIDIEFELGDLEVALSREHLSYTPRVIKNIAKRAGEVLKELRKQIEENFKNCDSLFEARCLAQDLLYNYNGSLYRFRHMIDCDKIEWQGQKLGGERIRVGVKNATVHRLYADKSWNWRTNSANHKCRVTRHVGTVEPTRKLKIVENTLKIGGHSRTVYNIEQGKYTNVLLVKFDTDVARKDFLEQVGCKDSDLIDVTDLDEKPTAGRSRSGGGVDRTVCVYNDGNHRRKTDWWTPADVDFDIEDGIYVRVKNTDWYNNFSQKGYLENPSALSAYLRHLKTIGEHPGTIHGIKKSKLKNVTDNSDWQTLDEYIEEVRQDILKDTTLADNIANASRAANFHDHVAGLLVKYRDKFAQGGKMREFLEMYWKCKEAAKTIPNSQNYICALDSLGIKIQKKKATALSVSWDGTKTFYPMLTLQDTRYRNNIESTNVAVIIDYCNQLDKLRGI